jgi:hypothetical protein
VRARRATAQHRRLGGLHRHHLEEKV